MQTYLSFCLYERTFNSVLQENTSPTQVFVQVCARKQQKREPTIADSLHLNVYESKLKHLRVPVRFRFIVESIVVKHQP